MNNREIEAKIKNAVEKTTPDVWERVQHDISHGKGELITMSDKRKKGKALGFISSIAAALVLVSMAIFGITNYSRADLKVVGSVYLEVNPQIELSINTYDVVLEATPKNEDGKKVLGRMELKDTQLDVALNAILGSMVKNGYLTSQANSVLISVEHQSSEKAKQLNGDVLKAVKNNDFQLATVVQTVNNTEKLKAQAKNLNITSGKAEFIQLIKENGVKASEEELSKLSVHELNVIFQSHIKNNEIIKGADYKGTATQNKYIGIQKAKEIALKDAKVNQKDVRDFDADLDLEKGKMVYEVEFEVGNTEYDYELDAVSGKILFSHKEGSKSDTEVSSKLSNSTSTSSAKADAIIAPEDALKKAVLHATGLASSKVADVDVELDEERGIYHYDVDFKHGGYEYEYEINAVSGEIIKSDKDRDD